MLILLTAAVTLWRNSVKKDEQQTKEYSAMSDTLKRTRNSLGQQVAKISLIQSQSAKDFLKLKTQDSTILTLQNEVKANQKRLGDQGAIIDLYTKTGGKFTGKTDSIIFSKSKDTSSNIVYLYPTYKSHIVKAPWIVADITASKDSTTFIPQITNQFSVVLGAETAKKGIFHIFDNPIPFAEVTDLNPYTTTSKLRAFQVINNLNTKNIGIGIQVGYGGQLNRGGVINLGPYIGIGVTKTFIRF